MHTFTCATVVAGLRAAANFAVLFAEYDRANRYQSAADGMVSGMAKNLYSREHRRFLRSMQSAGDGRFEPDATIDASLFAVFYFRCFPPEDEMVSNTMRAIKEKLSTDGGIGRFEHDGYMRVSDKIIGNPWFICTLWMADYYISLARKKEDLELALGLLKWVVDKALPSGVLAEQLNPLTGEHVSVSPLTWSHSTFVATVCNYLRKDRELSEYFFSL